VHVLYLFSPKDNISIFSLLSTVQLCNRCNNVLLLLGFVIIPITAIHEYTQYGMKIVILEYNQSGGSVISAFFINGKNIPNTA
jgi:hypothetical protein